MQTKLVNENFQTDYIDNLLLARGVKDLNEFKNPTEKSLQSYNDLDNVSRGFELIKEVIDNKKKVLIIVDSDIDGFTSAAIVYQYLYNFGIEADYFLHSGKQHGLDDCIDWIVDNKTFYDVVWLPDAGTNDMESHRKLKELGIKVLLTDHHDRNEETIIEDNVVLINNQTSDKYRNKELTGAGVTWQFCKYCDEQFGTDFANKLIDLAALGITGDMGSVLELENRYIIKTGFENIQNYYFKVLCSKQSYSMGGKINPTTVAFYIVPLINAMIRVGTPEEKERVFISFIDGHRMVISHKRGANGALEEVAVESARECTNARARQNRILEKAQDQIEIKIFNNNLLDNKILFIRLDEEDFPPELNGLLAMRFCAKYKKPTIVARLNSKGEDKGSLRGINDSELTDFKQFLLDSNYCEYVAGHPNASGVGIEDNKVGSLINYANEKLKNIDFGEKWHEINFERIATDQDIINIIYDTAAHEDLWGQHCPEPLIHIKDINITKKDIRILGKSQNTVKIEKFGISYMKFQAKDFIKELTQYDSIKLEVVGRANLNFFAGVYTPQIFIVDYEIKDNTLGF